MRLAAALGTSLILVVGLSQSRAADVIAMYDMSKGFTPRQEQAFVDLLKTGIGVVSLHHNVCWTTHFGKSRVFYLMFGHGPSAWENPVYPKLLERGIRWVAEKP